MNVKGIKMWMLMFTLAVSTAYFGQFMPVEGGILEGIGEIFGNLFKFPAYYVLTDGEEFEYVVVGAGAGGAAVASRLALAGKSVILLEAGGNGNDSPLAYIPGLALTLMGSSKVDWRYNTKPNNMSCLGSDGNQCRWSQGKGLGGSTIMNHLIYARGNHKDYDLDVPGWTWQELKPYFLRYEGLQEENLSSLPSSSISYHNTSGTMKIGFCAESKNTWHSRIVKGFQLLGFPFNPDINAESQIGVTRVTTYTHKGIRQSTATGYLLRDDVKKAIRISTETHVTRVLFDENNEAHSVTAVQGNSGRIVTVRATKGVVLSAGNVGTPKILMHSGVGPKEVLKKFNITVRSDLPVGKQITDHVLPIIIIRVDSPIYELLLSDMLGNLASIGLSDITAFANTSCYDVDNRLLRSGQDCDIPSVQVIHSYIDRGVLSIGRSSFKQTSSLNDDILDQITAENLQSGLITMTPLVLSPYSRGHVQINSEDPLEPPEIFPNYLADSRDVEEMLRSITVIEHLMETQPFRERNARLIHLHLKGCPSYESGREEYWRCYVRHLTSPTFHSAGSCALGKVLDPKLGVIGLKKTFVGDLSAMPRLPKSNTAAISIAIGERLAAFLLQNESEHL